MEDGAVGFTNKRLSAMLASGYNTYHKGALGNPTTGCKMFGQMTLQLVLFSPF